MTKTILAQVDGFTPLIDAVVLDVGLITAAVFGKAWRYCQMPEGVCRAAQDRIAKELGLSRATVNSHFSKLVESGYLRDTTPNLLGLPHIYTDTGKANLSISLTGGVKNIDRGYQKDLQVGVKNIDTKIEQETNKKEKEIIAKPDLIDMILEQGKKANEIQEACNLFEQSFGFGSLSWDAKPIWRKFAKWVYETYSKDSSAFKDYVTWRNGKGQYKGAMTNTAIRRDPQVFMDTGFPTFLAYVSMYPNGERVVQRPYNNQDNNRVILQAFAEKG